jgi:hypothetical protein
MRVSLPGVTLWFDVSGPSVVSDGATVIERPTVVAVHGGPGADHVNLKDALAPLAEHFQIIFYDSAVMAVVTTAPRSSGTSEPGPLTSGACATRSACAGR